MRKIIKNSVVLGCLLLAGCTTTKNAENTSKKAAVKKHVAEINIELGMAYLDAKDVQHAKQKLLQALHDDPSLPEVQYSMAYFFETTGEKELAEEYYQKAIQLAPQRGDTHNNYGTFLCRNGDYPAAIMHFNIAVKDPAYLDTAGAYENAGLCALKIPDDAAAKRYFEHAIAQDANHPVSLLHAAELDYKLHAYHAARVRLQAYLELLPANRATDVLEAELRKAHA